MITRKTFDGNTWVRETPYTWRHQGHNVLVVVARCRNKGVASKDQPWQLHLIEYALYTGNRRSRTVPHTFPTAEAAMQYYEVLRRLEE